MVDILWFLLRQCSTSPGKSAGRYWDPRPLSTNSVCLWNSCRLVKQRDHAVRLGKGKWTPESRVSVLTLRRHWGIPMSPKKIRWESELLSMELKNGIHENGSKQNLLKRRKVQSSQHRHWEAVKSPPPQVGFIAVFISFLKSHYF